MTCVLCEGALRLLGMLGRAVWMRCEGCGADQRIAPEAWRRALEAEQD